MKLEDLGYNDFFEAGRKELGLENFPIARVISEYRQAYKVKGESGESLAKITGKQMFTAASREDYPAVGDFVAVSELDKGRAVIRAVLPRKTIIKRKFGDKNKSGEKDKIQIIATNIDVAFVVESVGRDYNLNRIERYFAIAADGKVKPAIILNKIDLISEEELDIKLSQIKKRFSNISIIITSAKTLEGLDALKLFIERGKTYCFLGSSGVGKSSLINTLVGSAIIRTEDVGRRSGRGRHITTTREMYFLENGGIVIDNPGIREVGMADAVLGVDSFFGEITELASGCKYSDCTHTHEPGCRVLLELKSGNLENEKYSNYINLKKEAEYCEMSKFQKREKDKKFGKFIKKAKKELRKYS
jgi:ribosome biogenesis GTPase / thiamine phosphate phosphatase